MPWPQWLACSRRRKDPKEAWPQDETPFWEAAALSKKASGEQGEPEEEKPMSSTALGIELASHHKDEGNEKFARGATPDALESWANALDALERPPPGPRGPVAPGASDEGCTESEDKQIQELRTTLLLNLALGHKKLKRYREAVGYCDEVLFDQPNNVKALYRKAESLGELCAWQEAEEAAVKLEASGEEGAKLAVQRREDWRRRRKAEDGRQRKMWSAALSEPSPSPAKVEEDKEDGAEAPAQGEAEPWTSPKVEQTSVFDLRRKGTEWVEKEDFDDALWKDGLGSREATLYQRRALPLTLLAAAALGDLDLNSELVVHVLLDGNTAPFGEPHDWSVVLQRCPGVQSLTIVYIDLGDVHTEQGPPPMPYGTLLRPTEEGRVGDRVARAARFLGTYSEFEAHCKGIPGLVVPQLALWADVPLYGFGDRDFTTRLEAYRILSAKGIPSIITQGGEVPQKGGPPMTLRADEHAAFTMAVLDIVFGARWMAKWHWNRFVVPLDRGPYGVLAAHALVCVTKPSSKQGAELKPATVKATLRKRGVTPTAYKAPEAHLLPSQDPELDLLRQRQWDAFCKQMKDAGRPVGPTEDPREHQRQMMEFYHFCGQHE